MSGEIALKFGDVIIYEAFKQVVCSVSESLGHARIVRLDGKPTIIPNHLNEIYFHPPGNSTSNGEIKPDGPLSDIELFLSVNESKRAELTAPITEEEIMATKTKQKLASVPKMQNPRGGLAVEAMKNTSEDNQSTIAAEDTASPTPKKTKTAISYAGRSEFIIGLKKAGESFEDAFKKICERFPSSSSCNCMKVWKRPLKAENAKN
jgi:hypothetical protein